MNTAFDSKTKVAVAMSGGVDSSVAAALMIKEFGQKNVLGLTMKLFCYGEKVKEKNCCSLDAIDDARSVCQKLGIAHYVVDVEKEFEKEVIDNFVSEYEKGRTPNPCIRCNKLIKFDHLLKKARDYGADTLATGHYAKIKRNGSEYTLLKGEDLSKDQSYFLYNLDQKSLQHTLFPLGELKKSDVRKIAGEYDLVTAQKVESQDICFIPRTVGEFLAGKINLKQGKIVDKAGKFYGEHKGLALYTIGQRKGLGGGFPESMFVVGFNRDKRELIIGPENELFGDKLSLEKVSWISANKPKLPLKCTAKIRYQTDEAACLVVDNNKRISVEFDDAQKAITPGQSVVFYQKDRVIGGGMISG
ncbi:MAG: tRNA 2-thiouridine(34) synthase MnmA [Patescibacteria group bacterium]